MFGLSAIRKWWSASKPTINVGGRATVELSAKNARAEMQKFSTSPAPAEKSDLRERMVKALDDRLNARRRQWDQEDADLRTLIGAAGGSGAALAPVFAALGISGKVPLRSASEMAGLSARFDSALTTDDNREHWAMADGLAADAAANPMIRYTLRNRARYEIANNCYAMGVGETIANDFVGTGPRLHIDDERLTDDERADVEAKFAAWAAAINLPGKLRVMRKARRADGETFACKITNPNLNHPVKLDLRVIEADQVRFVDISLLLSPSVDGIRFDDYGNPVSYHILRIHPGYWSYATGYVGMPWEYDVWDASLVIHWFRQDRPGQHRGLPEILPALPLYSTLRRYTQAVLDAAETAADFAVLLKTESGAMAVDENGNTIDNAYEPAAPFSSVQLQRRMITTLPVGYSAEQMKPEQPAQAYGEFKREICAEIGRCECVSANVVLGDSSNSNMASGTLDHRITFRPREIEREEANRLILDNLLRDFIAEGVRIRDGNGDLGQPYLPAVLRDLGTSVLHSWYWDSNDLGDPLKLAAANSTALKDGATTLPEIYERRGKNYVKAMKAQARALGCTVEELQAMIRNSIFAVRGTDPVDASEDLGEAGGEKPEKPVAAPAPRSNPAVKRPAQAAMRKANA